MNLARGVRYPYAYDFRFLTHFHPNRAVPSGMVQTFNERLQFDARNTSCYLKYFC